jgi:uncharacterized protein DUF1579
MRSSALIASLSIGVLSIAAALAQDAAPAPPKPGPEVAKLSTFLGTWKGKADVKASPFGPAGKMTWTETCDWFEGGFQVVCKSTAETPQGKRQSMSILRWDTEADAYEYFSIDSGGASHMAEGSVTSGGTWTFGSESMMEKQIVRSRYTLRNPSPTTKTFTFEIQREHGGWTVVSEGSSEKSK